MSTLKTGAIRGTSGSADSIQIHATNQSVTFPGAVTITGNATCSGTPTGFGGGKHEQTVFAQINPTSNIDTTSASRQDTGLGVTITPVKASSKLLVHAGSWQYHMNPGPQSLDSQSLAAFVEMNVASAGWVEPDGTAATSTARMWSVRDWHNHDYEGRDGCGNLTYIWSPSYTLGQAIQVRITYQAGNGADSGSTTTSKYFHHVGGAGSGNLLTIAVSEISS